MMPPGEPIGGGAGAMQGQKRPKTSRTRSDAHTIVAAPVVAEMWHY